MTKYANKTRKAKSIPRKLFREGKVFLIPVYYLFLLSSLANEGIKNSGSYKFADHIYVYKPQGRWVVGKLVDKLLLSLKPAKSFRNRYLHSRDEVLKNLNKFSQEEKINILSVPSGIPRELVEAATTLAEDSPELLKRVYFHCLDLDNQVHKIAKSMVANRYNFLFHNGDALENGSYRHSYHIVVSTGLGEFLDDQKLIKFYNLIYEKLAKNGTFVTTATSKHLLSDYLMKNLGELITQYRTLEDMKIIFSKTSFSKVNIYNDKVGLQTIVVAEK